MSLFPEIVTFTFLVINYFVSLILNNIHLLHMYDYFVKCTEVYGTRVKFSVCMLFSTEYTYLKTKLKIETLGLGTEQR